MPNKPIRFLVVDDIAENIMALEALLRRDRLVVDRARSATEALELMLVHDYALAFLDVQMPGTDGYELAELMRGTERTRSVPIIFVTAAEMDEARRFRGYEAGAVDYIFKPIDPVVLKSKAEVFFRIGLQAKELERQRDEMQALARHRDEAMARLKAHTDNSPLGFVELDRDLVIRAWSEGAERLFGRSGDAMLGAKATETGWIGPATAEDLRGWLDADPKAPRFSAEITPLHGDGHAISCEVYGSVLGDGLGAKSLSLQVLDISERKQAEEVRSLLIGELNHRIKNTLANVQSIARQSLRQSASLPQFEQSFTGRLQALARAHSILSDATWASAPLDQLIDDQISSGTLDGDRLRRSGPPVELAPETMLRLALTLHELGTNAAKYGALSAPEGEVHLDWTHEDGQLVLTWRETGGPEVTPPDGSGFGTILIGAAGGGDEAAATAEWKPGGVVWTIRINEGVSALRQAAPPAAEVAPPAGRRSPASLEGARVLLVEDEPLVAMDLQFELEDAGAEVVAIARTVPEAMELARESALDLALLDGNLRGEPVDEVAELLTTRGVPFCFVSGYGREHLPQAFMQAPLIEKPFRPDALRAILTGILIDLAEAKVSTAAE